MNIVPEFDLEGEVRHFGALRATLALQSHKSQAVRPVEAITLCANHQLENAQSLRIIWPMRWHFDCWRHNISIVAVKLARVRVPQHGRDSSACFGATL
jgi:hypothetical protein